MKKGSFAQQLFLYASLVSLLWLGGYVLLVGVFSVSETLPEKPSVQTEPEVSIPAPNAVQWSVLAVTDEEREVTKFFLRYADFVADTLVFIDVPTNTKVELAAGGYEVLSVYKPELPKLFMVSDLCNIFSEETWCMAAEEVGLALLGVRPKECYIVEETLFHKLTESVEGEAVFLRNLSIKDTIVAVTEQGVTNDTLQKELMYWESYHDVDAVLYAKLPGKALAEEYIPDAAKIKQMTQEFQAGIFTFDTVE